MIQKIKTCINQFIDYTLTDEFKTIVMLTLFLFATIGTFWAIISTTLVDEAIETLKEQQSKYEELETKYNVLETDFSRLKAWEEELYDLFSNCQTTNSWYEDFYYDNVDPYTGEIEGEYYE